MAEVLVDFTEPVVSPTGEIYRARACGAEAGDGLWHGWIEFLPAGGGPLVRSGRETTQPNRQDAVYWATGLTPVYLEGALQRAQGGPQLPAGEPVAPSILNPFSVYRKGEALLRRQLHALSPWHLVNIVRGHNLSAQSDASLNALSAAELVELIVTAVKLETGESGV